MAFQVASRYGSNYCYQMQGTDSNSEFQLYKVAGSCEKFVLILYIPVNNFSVMPGRVFLCCISTKQGEMCLAQGYNALLQVKLEPATLDLESSTLPLSHYVPSHVKRILRDYFCSFGKGPYGLSDWEN